VDLTHNVIKKCGRTVGVFPFRREDHARELPPFRMQARPGWRALSRGHRRAMDKKKGRPICIGRPEIVAVPQGITITF
jgi:hypothetical protein